MMLGDKVTATEAEKMGMIYKVFSADEYADGLVKMTATLAQMPTLAFGLTKKALNHSFENTLEQQLQLEDKLQFAAAHTEDYQEGVAAFMEKRNPNFKGK